MNFTLARYVIYALQEAAAEYVELMKVEAEVDKTPIINVEEDPAKCLPASW